MDTTDRRTLVTAGLASSVIVLRSPSRQWWPPSPAVTQVQRTMVPADRVKGP